MDRFDMYELIYVGSENDWKTYFKRYYWNEKEQCKSSNERRVINGRQGNKYK